MPDKVAEHQKLVAHQGTEIEALERPNFTQLALWQFLNKYRLYTYIYKYFEHFEQFLQNISGNMNIREKKNSSRPAQGLRSYGQLFKMLHLSLLRAFDVYRLGKLMI